jgi:tRNA (adenine57-N1/adenine58-N1)-methyltransferase
LASAIDKLKKSEQKREAKRQNQIARSNKRKLEDLPETDIDNVGGKRFKMQESVEEGDVGVCDVLDAAVDSAQAADPTSSSKMFVSKACPEVRGHTSYLTFARLVPAATSSATNRQ